jgi:hypothetical protein
MPSANSPKFFRFFFAIFFLAISVVTPVRGNDSTLVLTRARHVLGLMGPIPAWRMSGTIRAGKAIGSVALWTDASRPAYAEYDTGPRQITGASGYDGNEAWTQSADGVERLAPGPPRSVLAGEAYVLSGAIFRLANAAERIDAGPGVDAIRFSPHGIAPFDVWFSHSTGLPERAIFYGEDTHVYQFSDYRTVGTYVVPFLINEDDQVVRLRSASETVGKTLARVIPAPPSCDCGIAGERSSRVSITLDGAHIIIGVRLNGRGPYQFVLDTGGHNIMSREVAGELGVAIFGTGRSGGIGSSTVPVSFTAVKRVEVGRAYMLDQSFKIMDIRNGFGRGFSQRIDGVIGYQLLARFRTTIDYAKRRVTLSRAQSSLKDAFPFLFDGDMPAVTARVGTKSGWFGLDTGSGASLTLLKPFWQKHYPPPTRRVYGSGGIGIGGGQSAWYAMVRDLRWDGYHFPALVTDFENANNGDLATTSIAGYFAGNILSRFAITFDYRSQELELVPNPTLLKPERMQGSGMRVMRANGGVLIYTVLTGSPAYEAGIRSDSILLSVDGKPVKGLSLAQIRTLLSPLPGTPIAVGVDNGAGLRTVQLISRNMLP